MSSRERKIHYPSKQTRQQGDVTIELSMCGKVLADKHVHKAGSNKVEWTAFPNVVTCRACNDRIGRMTMIGKRK